MRIRGNTVTGFDKLLAVFEGATHVVLCTGISVDEVNKTVVIKPDDLPKELDRLIITGAL